MKKLILLIAISFSITAAFAQAGINGGTHNVTNESKFSYVVNEGLLDTDTYKWEVFSDANCSPGNEINPAAGPTGTYTFVTDENAKEVEITWNNAPAAPATTTYYLRVSQKGANNCFTYQTIEIIITNKDDNAGLNFAFVGPSQEECSVDYSGTAIDVIVTLTGSSLIHDATNPAKIRYSVDGDDKGWIAVGTTLGAPNQYTVSFPAGSFVSPDVNAPHNFAIVVSEMENGNGGTIKDINPDETYTIKAWGLPTMTGISIK